MEGTAAFDQDSFRGRNDDGSETTATWKAAANANWTQGVDANFRVRFVIQETAGFSLNNFAENLEYNRNAAGWVDVTAASSVVVGALSANYADGDDTTQQIGAGTFIANNNGMVEGDGGPASSKVPDYAGNDETEFEFCVQIVGADVADADTIELRVTRGGTVLDSYTNTPSITVSKPAAAARRIFVVT